MQQTTAMIAIAAATATLATSAGSAQLSGIERDNIRFNYMDRYETGERGYEAGRHGHLVFLPEILDEMRPGGSAPAGGSIGAMGSGMGDIGGGVDRRGGVLDPFYGDINPFYGDINPFYGDISPFWGDISPFWGDINPFYGTIDPFYGNIDPFWGDIEPFYGDIGPFWGDIGPFWGDIAAFWGDIDPFSDASAGDYARLVDDLNTLLDRTEAVFGELVQDGWKDRDDDDDDDEGGSTSDNAFRNGFIANLFERYSIDLNDPASLERLDARDRSAFFLEFYDGLMSFSGNDRVDHWMPTINWSPRLSQGANEGKDVRVGVIDFSLPEDHVAFQLDETLGDDDYLGINHGIAVAGLIGDEHDGEGGMGVAPEAKILIYNPFDESFTAGWRDVRQGLNELYDEEDEIHVINLSLGVTGWTLHYEWADMFRQNVVRENGDNTLFVLAAGNSGAPQYTNVDWDGVSVLDNMLIVGSVNPNGEISTFSNRPGEACLLIQGQCGEGHRLMDRFLVAPGELILVNDGEGGMVRMSGTSFAAPMVSGAAALVRSRWEWLGAADTADVLLRSARDLGDPGVDAVYGHGLLDVEASLSPFVGESLYYFNDKDIAEQVNGMALVLDHVDIKADDDYSVAVFQSLNDTFRDFEIRLSELTEQTGPVDEGDAAGNLAERIYTWDGRTSFTDTASLDLMVSRRGNLEMRASVSRTDPLASVHDGELSFQAGMRITDTESGRELRFGAGEGALALNQQTGFGLFSDHRPETGGVNPILGFASGGAYAMAGMDVGEHTQLSFGLSSNHDERLWTNPFTGEENSVINGLSAYEAIAFITDLRHQVSDSVSLHATYTRLDEATGFLGGQGAGMLALEGGVTTNAVTLGAEAVLPMAVTLSSSATVSHTGETRFDSGLLAVSEAPVSTAFQITARRDGVLGEHDAVRVSLIQPLHVETGSLEYTATRVIDRETGELGTTSEIWQLGGTRPLQAELLYATPVFEGRADLSLFGRIDLSEGQIQVNETALVSGARFKIDF
ncbi:S8 family peptidase [Maricaulis sp. CAU 1757]